MEITEELANGNVDFVFYLNGDAYTAPAIYKESYIAGNPQPTTGNLFYLHRDHLGSSKHCNVWKPVLSVVEGY